MNPYKITTTVISIIGFGIFCYLAWQYYISYRKLRLMDKEVQEDRVAMKELSDLVDKMVAKEQHYTDEQKYKCALVIHSSLSPSKMLYHMKKIIENPNHDVTSEPYNMPL